MKNLRLKYFVNLFLLSSVIALVSARAVAEVKHENVYIPSLENSLTVAVVDRIQNLRLAPYAKVCRPQFMNSAYADSVQNVLIICSKADGGSLRPVKVNGRYLPVHVHARMLGLGFQLQQGYYIRP